MAYTHSTKKIATNTMFLYIRMLLVMAVSLYTSRVILQALGVVDFGIYNVVGGFVSMFSVINICAAASTSRFLSFSLGKDDTGVCYKKVFGAAFTIHTLAAILVVIIVEPIGIWYINNEMVLPPERISAAMWVFQLSLLSCLIGYGQCPYDASITANEKMSMYAYISIVETGLKLSIAYLVMISSGDKLILYAILYFSIYMVKIIFYRIYCVRSFGDKCRLSIVTDKSIYKELLKYSGWEFFGNLGLMARTHGVTLVLNAFAGPVVNAARAVASQVEAAVNGFVVNFLNASRPVVIKHYAAGNQYESQKVMLATTKYSMLLFSCLAIPVIIEADNILGIWLFEVPDYTASFLRVIILTGFASTVDKSLAIGVQAIGDVKRKNMFSILMLLLELPLVYLFLRVGYSPVSAFVVLFLSALFIVYVNVWIVNKGYKTFSMGVFFRLIITVVGIVCVSSVFPILIHLFCKLNRFAEIIAVTSLYILTLSTLSYFIILDRNTKQLIHSFIKSKIP